MNYTQYFKHDCNSRSDFKMINIRKKYGLLGYGIYFCIIEMLCSHTKYEMELDIDNIVFELKEDKKIIEDIILNNNLFKIKKNMFFSPALKKRMKTLDNMREARSKGGKKRWEKEKDVKKSIYREFEG